MSNQVKKMFEEIIEIIEVDKKGSKKFDKITKNDSNSATPLDFVGMMSHCGFDNEFNAVDFLGKYLVKNEGSSAGEFSIDKVLKKSLRKNYEDAKAITEHLEKISVLEIERKFYSDALNTEQLKNKKLSGSNKSLKLDVSVLRTSEKNLVKQSNCSTEDNIELLAEIEKVVADNEALKRTIKLMK